MYFWRWSWRLACCVTHHDTGVLHFCMEDQISCLHKMLKKKSKTDMGGDYEQFVSLKTVLPPQARLTRSQWWEKKLNLSCKGLDCNLKKDHFYRLTVPSGCHCSQLCYCFTITSLEKVSWLSAMILLTMHYLSHQLLLSLYIVRISV